MIIALNIDHKWHLTFSTRWWKPEIKLYDEHGSWKQYSFAWFSFTKRASPADWLFHYHKIGKLDQFLEFVNVKSIPEYIERDRQFLSKRDIKNLDKLNQRVK